MSVQPITTVCKVRARVVRVVARGKQTRSGSTTVHTSSVVLLRLQEVDGRSVGNIRAYVHNNKSISKLRLIENDVLEFIGEARSGKDGYHFVNLKNIQVNRGDMVDGVRGTRVVGVLPSGMSLREYLDRGV